MIVKGKHAEKNVDGLSKKDYWWCTSKTLPTSVITSWNVKLFNGFSELGTWFWARYFKNKIACSNVPGSSKKRIPSGIVGVHRVGFFLPERGDEQMMAQFKPQIKWTIQTNLSWFPWDVKIVCNPVIRDPMRMCGSLKKIITISHHIKTLSLETPDTRVRKKSTWSRKPGISRHPELVNRDDIVSSHLLERVNDHWKRRKQCCFGRNSMHFLKTYVTLLIYLNHSGMIQLSIGPEFFMQPKTFPKTYKNTWN